jgi:hypothetical protein
MPDPEKDWNPDDEVDLEKLQRENLIAGKKFLERMERENAEAKARQEAYATAPGQGAPAYTPPSFEQISVAMKEAWDEVKRIAPDAPDGVKIIIFQGLLSSHARGPHGFFG